LDRVVEVDIAANAALLTKLLARDGLCVVYGSGAAEFTLPFFPMILGGIGLRCFIVYELSPPARAECEALLTRWLTEEVLLHALAGALPLAECASAHELIQAGSAIGNIVLDIA
jgi:NADPH2:quinone reductase